MNECIHKPACAACFAIMLPRFGKSCANHWRCPRCGLECIFPQPDDQTLAQIYNTSYFVHYQSELNPQIVRAMKRATYANQLRRLAPAATTTGHNRLLDCGAATGYLAELAREIGWDAFAIEFSEFGASSCEKLLGPGRVYRGQVQDATFAANPESQFSVITMFDFIEHVRDPGAVLQWAKQRLDSQGVLLMTTPRVSSLSWRLLGRQWFHYTSREHLWFFSPKSLRILLEDCGFRSVQSHPLAKAVTVGYALAHYARSNSYSRVFTPLARALASILPAALKRLRFWFYLGEMVVLARPQTLQPGPEQKGERIREFE